MNKNLSSPSKKNFNIGYFLKPILVSLGIVFIAFFIFVIFLNIYDAVSPFFEKDQVIETCRVLAFPSDSTFCKKPATQNATLLLEALNQHYPTNLTTLTQLKDTFLIQIYCNNEMYCKNELPIDQVYLIIDYNKKDLVTGYYISDQRGSN